MGSTVCEPYQIYVALVLIPHDRVRMDDVEAFNQSCIKSEYAKPSPLAKAMLAAFFNEFGEQEYRTAILAAYSADEAPADDDSGGTKLAMTLSFLVRGGAPPEIVQKAIDELYVLGTPRTLQLPQQAWMARAGADVAARAGGTGAGERPQLEISPVDFFDAGALGEQATIVTPFISLEDFTTSGLTMRNAGELPLSAELVVEGVLKETETDGRAGPFEIKRRIFDAAGREIGLENANVRIGDNLLVVVEGRRIEPLPSPDEDRETIGELGSGLIVADLLPSALEIVTPNAFDPSALRRALPPGIVRIGELRSVEPGDDRLVAVVLPRAIPADQAGQTAPSSEGTGAGEEKEAAGTATEPDGQPPVEPVPRLDSGAPVDFRIAYYVRVNAAGEFVLPPTLVEPMAMPVTTSWTAVGRLTVERTGPQ